MENRINLTPKNKINEIADRLLCAANGVTITPKEAKEMYNAIMK